MNKLKEKIVETVSKALKEQEAREKIAQAARKSTFDVDAPDDDLIYDPVTDSYMPTWMFGGSKVTKRMLDAMAAEYPGFDSPEQAQSIVNNKASDSREIAQAKSYLSSLKNLEREAFKKQQLMIDRRITGTLKGPEKFAISLLKNIDNLVNRGVRDVRLLRAFYNKELYEEAKNNVSALGLKVKPLPNLATRRVTEQARKAKSRKAKSFLSQIDANLQAAAMRGVDPLDIVVNNPDILFSLRYLHVVQNIMEIQSDEALTLKVNPTTIKETFINSINEFNRVMPLIIKGTYANAYLKKQGVDIKKKSSIKPGRVLSQFAESLVKNKTDIDTSIVEQLINNFYPYAEQQLQFNESVSVDLISDGHNAQNPLGKTAYYDPSEMKITLFIDDRHPKDILRSFSHELVHHAQNCRGEFDNIGEVGEGYAQSNEHLREMEREAYERGNLILRDWEDNLKQKIKENKKMKVDEGTLRKAIRSAITSFLEEQNSIFAPNHYCAHHVRENNTGREGTVVNHNWNETLQEVTKYDVKFENEVVENIPVSELTILEASLPEAHGGHMAKRDDDAKPDFLDLDDDGDTEESMADAAKEDMDEAHCPGKREDDLEELDEVTEGEDVVEEDTDNTVSESIDSVSSFFQKKNQRINEELIRRWTKK
jgi:hypothetical protein